MYKLLKTSAIFWITSLFLQASVFPDGYRLSLLSDALDIELTTEAGETSSEREVETDFEVDDLIHQNQSQSIASSRFCSFEGGCVDATKIKPSTREPYVKSAHNKLYLLFGKLSMEPLKVSLLPLWPNRIAGSI